MEELIAKYLADELGAKQRADFESKLIQDEQLSLEFEAYLNAWDLQDKSPGDRFDSNAAWNNVQKQITETPVVEMKKSNFYFLKIAATLLIVAVAGYFVIQKNGETPVINGSTLTVKATTNSSTEAFQLPDGTEVRLNANSKITYDDNFGTTNRNIILRGQADFDVERNETLPFVISAGNGRVEVLGTSFDVAAYPGKVVKVAVTEGRVEFSSTVNEEEKAVLTQGQQAKIDKEGQNLEVSDIKDDNFKGWWTKELNFDNDSFEEIFDVLESTYQVEISYPEAFEKCRWTYQSGPDKSVENLLAQLKASYRNLEYTIKENQIILEGSACAN